MNYDFGKQKEGSTLTKEFSLPKQLREVIPNCSCTSYSLNFPTITVSWKTKVRRQDRYSETSITLEYTDGSIDDITLSANLEQ